VAKHFGARDEVACPECKGVMVVMRRMPHPAQGAGYELQTLECTKCGHSQTRTVDGDGKPPIAAAELQDQLR
jgi:phage FluMu protein Com